jgi:hypothetical protein
MSVLQLLESTACTSFGDNMLSLDKLKKNYPVSTTFDCVYARDSLYEVMKQRDVPACWLFSTEEEFLSLPHWLGISAVVEECYVQSIVQYMIPLNGYVQPRQGFELVLTALKGGSTWFNTFAKVNVSQIEKTYDRAYMDIFWNAVAEGRLKVNEEKIS